MRIPRQIALLVCLVLAACAGRPWRLPSDPWPAFAEVGFRTGLWSAQGLSLRGALRASDLGGPLHVYIEGDGRAWLTRNRPSRDPTPSEAIAAGLALADAGPAVFYLARPCQWHGATTDASCERRYWTFERYSEVVVAAYRDIIAEEQARRRDPAVVLIGYSGGGVLAALLARRLDAVAGLITVAANLDTAAWTEHHRVSALTGSLNPASEARPLEHLPQRHWAGGRDVIVPAEIIQAYARKRGQAESVRILPEADHHCCWVAAWPGLLRESLDALR